MRCIVALNGKSLCWLMPSVSYWHWWLRWILCCPHPCPKPQEVQLSQRDREMLLVIEYFAKSLKLTYGHSKWHSWEGRKSLLVFCCNCLYVVPYLRYSALNNGVIEMWVRGHSTSLKLTPLESFVRFPLAFRSNYGLILYHFRDKAIFW